MNPVSNPHPQPVDEAAAADAAPRPRAAHLGPERRRPQILDVAFELFVDRGYRATSMEEIARAAGVSKPVVYACFSSKAELFGELLDREEQRMLAQFGAALTAAGRRREDPEATLIAGFTAMLRAVTDTPEAYRIALLGGGGADAVIDMRVRRGREHEVAALAAAAREWLDGKVPPEGVDAAAQFVGHTLLGIGEAGVRMLLTAPEQWTPETLGRTLGRLVAGGYAALTGGSRGSSRGGSSRGGSSKGGSSKGGSSKGG
jgi:AcrR family transcriptional regulator